MEYFIANLIASNVSISSANVTEDHYDNNTFDPFPILITSDESENPS
jgi:hypothetical protein